MPKNLLPVSHWKQRQQADCLAACAAMILSYLGQTIEYDQLLRLLVIGPIGAPSSNTQRLGALNVIVTYERGSVADLETHLEHDTPCIVFVQTSELPYWSTDTGHAVVVVGMDEDTVYLNDPALGEAPQTVSRGDFQLAWLARDYRYAVITRRP